MRLIDGDTKITALLYNDEHEETERVEMSIADFLDGHTEEGCPQAVGGWISVKDRLPEEKENPYTKDYQEVLCVLSTRFGTDVRVYKFGKGHFWNGPREIDRVISHWMPFPELPKEEKR